MTAEITLLGQVAAGTAGQDAGRVYLRSPRARVAFALLMLERRRGVGRDELADAVWAERPPSSWRSALRNVVKEVRDFVAAAFPGGVDPLVTENGLHLLRLPDEIDIDIERAIRRAEQARTALDAGRFCEAQNAATQVCALLRAPFLPDRDSEWVTSVRSRLDELLLDCLDITSQGGLAQGDPGAALATATEAIARAPLREGSHRCQMRAHAAAGDRGAALRTYYQLRHQLADELGVDPSPETEQLYLDLLGPVTDTAVRPVEQGTATTTRFVGRHAELRVLSDAWQTATQGTRQLVVLTGEAGIGKTRLVIEASRPITAQGGLVLLTRCDWTPTIPCQPIVELLDSYIAAAPQSTLPTLSSRARRSLEVVLPALGGPTPATPTSDRAALYDAVTAVIKHAVRDRPVLAVFDDVQWADADTVGLLRHMMVRTRDCRLMVAAIGRNLSRQAHSLQEAVRALEADAVHRVPVGPLPVNEVRAVAYQLQQSADHPALNLHELMLDTDGNPLLLVELLRSLPSSGPASPSRIPPSIRDLVATLLADIGAEAAALVRAGSVTPGCFEPHLAGRVARLTDEALLDALDAAVTTGLLVEIASERSPPHYRFAQDLVRRAVDDGLGAQRRRLLHRRWAEALGTQATTLVTTLAAHRLAAAGPRGDREAVQCAQAAAGQAHQRKRLAQRMELLQQALAHVPSDDVGLRAETMVELGLAQAEVYDRSSEETLLAAAALARACKRPDLHARAALGLTHLARSRPELQPDAAALIKEVLPPAGGGDAWDSIDAMTRARLVARSVELGGAGGGSRSLLRAASYPLCRRLETLTGPDHLDERDALADDLAAVADALDDPTLALTAAHHRATVAATLSEEPKQLSALEALAKATSASGSWEGYALLDERSVGLAATEGHFTQGMTTAATIASRSRDEESHLAVWPPPGAIAPSQILVIHYLRANLDQSTSSGCTQEHQGQATETDRIIETVLAGELPQARLAAYEVAAGTEPLPAGDVWLHAAGMLALAVADVADAKLAGHVHELLAPYAELICCAGYRSFVGPVRFHLGRLAAVTGDWAEAEIHLRAALGHLTAIRARPWIVLAQRALLQTAQARCRTHDRPWLRILQEETGMGAHRLGQVSR